MSNLTNEDLTKAFNVSDASRSKKATKKPTKEETKMETVNNETVNVSALTETDEDSALIDVMSQHNEQKERHLLIIGCGDGGCNIAAAVKTMSPDNVKCVMYNTSDRAMRVHEGIADRMIIPKTEDGSGKDRSYSKNVFKSAPHTALISEVKKLVEAQSKTEHKVFDYIIVFTTCDGGTGGGASPMVAKFLDDNFQIPTIICGVLPALAEDAIAQYNALAWQADVDLVKIPYIVFDNDHYSGNSKLMMHNSVNMDIARCMEVIGGTAYGNTLISSIDNRDMLQILINSGKRIAIYDSDRKPRVNESLDQYIENLIKNSAEPIPKNALSVGVFVRGPKQFIESVDTSLMEVRQMIGGTQMFTHLQESDNIRISLIASGCSAHDERMYMMRQRYEDIVSAKDTDTVDSKTIMQGMVNPFANKNALDEKKIVKSGVNLDALELI